MQKNNKSKVCIVSTVNLMHMTLVSLYTEYLQKNGIKYDIVYIDKYGVDEVNEANNVYKYYVKNTKSKILKMINVLRFTSYAKKIIRQNKYDLLIVWNELTAVLMSNFLAKKYKGKYIVNIRDYGFNDLPFIKKRTKRVIKSSSLTMVSSNRFLEFLPKMDKYLFVHSLNKKIFENVTFEYRKKEANQAITILFIGKMSYLQESKRFIEKLGNDKRFLLKFVGAGTEELKPFIEEKQFKNVEIIGAFSPNDTAKYLVEADIINNLYKFGTTAEDTALSIKLYYSIYLKIPILTYDNTNTNTYAEKAGVNITIPNEEPTSMADFIYNKYQCWDEKQAREKAGEVMKEIIDSQNALNDKMKEILKE